MGTHEETLGLGLHVQEDEREAHCKANPEDDETRNEAHEGGDRRKVAERLRAEETWEGILFHCAVAVLLLCVEHVRDLGHDSCLGLRPGLVAAAEREGVDAEGRGQVDLVVLIRAWRRACGGEVAVVDALCGRDEVLAGDGLRAGDDGGCT